MTFYKDMSPCLYFGSDYSSIFIAIGWLDWGFEYSVGEIDIHVYRKLCNLLIDPFQFSALPFSSGSHECTLCQFDGQAGSDHIFIPYRDKIFVAPKLINHYISCHRYMPPKEFLSAIQECPSDTRSMEYKKALLLVNGARILFK